jgi:hypothetical protein
MKTLRVLLSAATTTVILALQWSGTLKFGYQRIIMRFVQPMLFCGMTMLGYYAFSSVGGTVAFVLLILAVVAAAIWASYFNNKSRRTAQTQIIVPADDVDEELEAELTDLKKAMKAGSSADSSDSSESSSSCSSSSSDSTSGTSNHSQVQVRNRATTGSFATESSNQVNRVRNRAHTGSFASAVSTIFLGTESKDTESEVAPMAPSERVSFRVRNRAHTGSFASAVSSTALDQPEQKDTESEGPPPAAPISLLHQRSPSARGKSMHEAVAVARSSYLARKNRVGDYYASSSDESEESDEEDSSRSATSAAPQPAVRSPASRVNSMFARRTSSARPSVVAAAGGGKVPAASSEDAEGSISWSDDSEV